MDFRPLWVGKVQAHPLEGNYPSPLATHLPQNYLQPLQAPALGNPQWKNSLKKQLAIKGLE